MQQANMSAVEVVVSQEAEESYEHILDISDEISISVPAIIQYLQWGGRIEAIEDYDLLDDNQCTALEVACEERIPHNYIKEWRVIYMSKLVINSLFSRKDTKGLNAIFTEARNEYVDRNDIVNRVLSVLTNPLNEKSPRLNFVCDLFQKYIEGTHLSPLLSSLLSSTSRLSLQN